MAQLLLARSLTLCPHGLTHRAPSLLSKVNTQTQVAHRLYLRKQCCQVGTYNAKLSHISVPLISRLTTFTKRGALLAFVSPLEYIRRRREPHVTYEDEVLSNIPKEVFKKDVLIKKRKKRNIIYRTFAALLRTTRFVLRFIRLSLTFCPIFAFYPVSCLHQSLRRCWWRWLLWACEFSGPTFTKLGQWAGTRRDLFSEEFCELFSTLHTKVKPHSWFMTRKKLTKAFGKNWTQIFVAVDRKPLGSGCIAQVHKGYMRSDMIPDETVIEEALDDDEDRNELDFSEGLEIVGFGHAIDAAVGTGDDSPENPEFERSWRWWRQKGVPYPTTPRPASVAAPVKDDSASANEQKAENQESNPEDEVQLIPVAIKVLHPGVFTSAKRDISILHFVARVAESLIPGLRWLSLPDCVAEFSELMTKQVDLRYECRSLEKFVDNFADNPNIRFPRPIRPYCKRDVLVETYEEGEHISNFVSEDTDEPFPNGFRETLASYGLDALLQMIFVDNLVHGDLHPGNILVQNADNFIPEEENKLVLVDVCDTVVVNVRPADNPVRLVLLDVGISSSLAEADLQNFKAVFTAIVIGEGEKVAELMLKHATHNECKDVAAFKRDLGAVVMEARRMTIKLGKIDVGPLLLNVFKTLNRHKVKMESNFASIVLAIFVLEGLGRSLDPEIDILERAKPILLSA